MPPQSKIALWRPILPLLCIFLALATSSGRAEVQVTREQALEIGKKIWRNECDGTIEGLTSWNEGENFASLGICHFIWYPKNYRGPFEESFPLVRAYIQSRGAKLPEVLLKYRECPWNSREKFLTEQNSPEMNSLRIFLRDTIELQAQFAAQRLEQALPRILETLPPAETGPIRDKFYRVAATPHGLYALIDYVNFKGEGIKETERYKGEGWGLLQVLQSMKNTAPGNPALVEFSAAAIRMLKRRVANSPPERDEKRWLEGWTERCLTYRNNK
ncbi:MAG: hypothetical protein PHD76_07205 [Methylacidiphilales bacterium]|nr:hypothetical protein [Candidatus Methylacidiphilales bacterium]